MRKLLTILLCLACFFVKGQSITYTPMSAGGYTFRYLKADSGFAVPFRNLSTGRGVVRAGSIVVNTADNIFYGFDGTAWLPLGGGGAAGTYVDSLSIVGNNLFYWEAGLGTGIQINKLDSVVQKAGTDSIYTYIGGVGTFVYRNIGASGGVSEVTSTTSDITITNGTTTPALTLDTNKHHSYAYLQTVFAALAHTHDASHIISGTLPIVRGGTGLAGIGSVGQQMRVAASGTALEYYTPTIGTGTVTNVSSSTSDITVINPTTTPVITLDTTLHHSLGFLDLRYADISNDSAFVRHTNIAVDTLRLYRSNGDSSDVLFDIGGTGITQEQLDDTAAAIRDDFPTGSAAVWGTITGTLSDQTDVQSAIDAKQETLISGSNIKTINGNSLLGSGDLVIAGSSWGTITGTLSAQTDLQSALDAKQDDITLTTTGTSGAATLIGSILNIPQYVGSSVTPAALTKTDDANVTLTLGGTPSTALLQATSLTLGWAGTLAATRGGTGTGTVAIGDLLYGSGVNTWSKLTAGTSGYVLTSGGAGVAPSWSASSGGSGWLLTGNAGTTAGTNFLGTTDNIALNFRVNNITAGRIPTDATPWKTSFGYGAIPDASTGVSNSAFGHLAGAALAGGDLNTLVGFKAGNAMTSGSSNTAIGFNAMQASTTSLYNTAVGYQALSAGTVAYQNTAIGYNAGQNTAAAHNVFIGYNAGQDNTTGGSNVAVGSLALLDNVSGSNVTAVGHQALNLSTGATNTALGKDAGAANTTGESNLYLGAWAGSHATTQSNQIFINTINRSNYTGDQTGSPIYIQQNATVSNQIITVNGALKLSSMTTTQRNAIPSPAAGMIIYNSTTNQINVYTTGWEAVTSL